MKVTKKLVILFLLLMVSGCSNTTWIGPGIVKYDTVNDLSDGEWYVVAQGGLHSTAQLMEAIRRKAEKLCKSTKFVIKYRGIEDKRVVTMPNTSWSQEFTDVHGFITCQTSSKYQEKLLSNQEDRGL